MNTFEASRNKSRRTGMVIRRTTSILSCVAVLMAGAAQSQTPPASPPMQFRQLRSEGVAAANAGELAVAASKFAEADALVVNHPGLTVLRARIALAAGDREAATRFWAQYARMGLRADPARDPFYADLVASPEFAPIQERLRSNGQPTGAIEPVVRIDDPVVPESVVLDSARDRWLISAVAGRTILQAGADGRIKPFLAEGADLGGVLGLALDPDGQTLWAATSGLPIANAPPSQKDRSALVRVDLESGRIVERIDPPGDSVRSFGDVATAPNGDVYVSDSTAGDVLRLRDGAAALEVVVPAGYFGSPQGLAPLSDGSALIVADYGSGLHRVELGTGAIASIPGPPDDTLVGIDALLWDGDDLIAVQNGVGPQRVLRLRMAEGHRSVEAVEVLAAAIEGLEEPTGGSIVERDLVFVSRTQFSAFNEDGSQKDGQHRPAVISRLHLD